MFGKNACVVVLFNDNQMSIIVWGITENGRADPEVEKHACFSPPGFHAAIFFCVTHDKLSERGTTRSLVLHKHSLCKWKLRRWKSKSAYTLSVL